MALVSRLRSAVEQLALVAETTAPRRVARDQLDLLPGGQRADLVERPATRSSTSTTSACVSGSSPCSRDRSMRSLIRWLSRAGLDLHPLGEVPHLLGVVAGGQHRLGEQGQRADRGLQLVADVGHEVAAHDVDPALLGEVVDEDEDRAGAQRRDAHAQLEQLPAERRAAHPHVLLAGVAVAATRSIRWTMSGIVTGVAVDQAQGAGARVGAQHRAVGRHHEGGGRQHAQDADDLVRHRWALARGAARPSAGRPCAASARRRVTPQG